MDLNISKKDLIVEKTRNEFRGKDHIIFSYFKSPSSGVGILKQEIFEKSNKENCGVVYQCALPGVSIDDVLEASNMGAYMGINFTQSETEEGFDLLRKEGLLKLIKIGDEFRYEVADHALEELLGELFHLYSLIMHKMEKKWKFICSPTKDECKWLESFLGTKIADEIRNGAYSHRHSLSNKKKKKYIKRGVKEEIKNIEQDVDAIIIELKRQYTETIEKYRFPIEKILEVIYPRPVQSSR